MKSNKIFSAAMKTEKFKLHPDRMEALREHLDNAQFFDFGYISNEQLVEESQVAMEAFYEGFLRLPADNCVFEHSWKNPDGRMIYSIYNYRRSQDHPDTNITALELRFIDNEDIPIFNGVLVDLEVLTQEAQLDYHLKKKFRAWRLRNPIHEDITDHSGSVCNLFEPLICMLGRLNAQGIERERIDPPEKLNKARVKKGKHPLVSYTKVKIAPYRPPLGHSGPRDEDYTPKRYHFRRGHIRRFANGQKTWVNSCFVGCPEHGEVKHTYEVMKCALPVHLLLGTMPIVYNR